MAGASNMTAHPDWQTVDNRKKCGSHCQRFLHILSIRRTTGRASSRCATMQTDAQSTSVTSRTSRTSGPLAEPLRQAWLTRYAVDAWTTLRSVFAQGLLKMLAELRDERQLSTLV
jgi:hypothetical protein